MPIYLSPILGFLFCLFYFVAVGEEWNGVRRLTGYGIDSSAHDDLVAARAGAEGLVTHADEDDGEEAEEKPGGGVDVPFLKDDAEVGRVPGEEHLTWFVCFVSLVSCRCYKREREKKLSRSCCTWRAFRALRGRACQACRACRGRPCGESDPSWSFVFARLLALVCRFRWWVLIGFGRKERRARHNVIVADGGGPG